jgi:arylsulfatase A-like enzyme
VRRDQWKLLVNADGSKPELYDLAADPGEKTNRVSEKPELASELKKLVLDWRATLPKSTN